MGVPGGLKVSATGSDFLEFGWEAVEGATGYEIQLSLKEGDWASVATATVTTTMHRFAVAAEKTGYARVRAHEGERQGAWSETAMGTSMAAPLVLAAPAPRMSGAGPDYIEWEWDAVADALAYEVRVAMTMDGLDAASPETVTGTMHRVDAEPETEMFLRVRASAGTTESPVVSEWSDAVVGMSEAAPIPFVVSMRPPEAGADSACSGQAFCPDDGTDPKKAMASVNPRMLVTSSHPARITPKFVDGSAGISVDVGAGEDETPFTYADNWDALQAAVVGEGATFEFRRLTVGAGQEAAPAGDARYITCGPFRCSEAAAEAPAAPVITRADTGICEEFSVDFRLVEGVFNNFDYVWQNSQFYWWGSDWRYHNTGLEFGWSYTLSHPATVTHEFTTLAADTPSGTLTVPGAPLEVTSTYLTLDMTPASAADSRVNKFGHERNWDTNRRTWSEPGPIRNGPNDCLPIPIHPVNANHHNGRDEVNPSYESFGMSLGALRPGEFPPLRRPDSCAVLVTDGFGHFDGNDLGQIFSRGPVSGHGNFASPNAELTDRPDRDYLPGYVLHVDPQVGVSWAGSEVVWGKDADPFADLQCERVTFRAADQYDKCERFEEEVEAFWGEGIVPRAADHDGPRGRYRLEFEFSGSNNTNGRFKRLVVRSDARTPIGGWGKDTGREWRPRGSRHASMWLQRAEPGITREVNPTRNSDPESGRLNVGIDGTRKDYDLYRMDNFTDVRATGGHSDISFGGARDSWCFNDVARGNQWRRGSQNHSRGNCWNPVMAHPLLERLGPVDPIRTWAPHELAANPLVYAIDNDPIYGDLGKIDMVGADGQPGSDGNPENFDRNPGLPGIAGGALRNEDADRCSADDGGEELCDAVVEITLEATFVLVRDTDTCETTIEAPLTCHWDADGDRRRGGDTTFPAGPYPYENGGNFFIECEAH